MIFFVFVCFSFFSFLSVPFLGMLPFSLFLRGDSEWSKYLFDGQMIVSSLLVFCLYWLVIFQNKVKGIFMTSLLFPFYWILHSVASSRALIEIVVKPFYWDKTEHGVSKFMKRIVARERHNRS
jgi:hypothetical protein